ncbi:MAG TPA: hypothetical protein DCP38_12100 [Acidobacteria bacterium]|jgi:dipeptidyl aminopeptidase/acylaminoacyl peptidase|nr:hypothetical protein [Acidobacteriota bacterium]MDP6371267.1 hypothetical protein [Vicinamibacterales bacterium]HAK56205.1 hypothetical protein [Acidobacteriota bacterium]|tara:strand:- start:710 stop:1723 length:1014 start_codon:yes stop_codon:yes gene_type:complete
MHPAIHALALALLTGVSATGSADVQEVLTVAEVDAVRQIGARIDGRLVWSSNRGGNHDLYLVDLASGDTRQLTDHPSVDFFSRFSPDGRQISFLRSRRPYVSFRERTGWDLYIMDADGGRQRRLARRAYHATWIPDGSGLVFERRGRIFRYDLATGEETLLHGGQDALIKGRLEEPEMLTDSLMSVAVRRVRRETVGILDLDAGVYTPMSTDSDCQITWMPGQRHVVWIAGQGLGGTRVEHRRLDDAAPEVLIDLPSEYSHEYFPRVTGNGEWLIWGAAAEGHEHDLADYELFVWKIGEPWDSALRLTHSPANDQWPDLWVMPASASAGPSPRSAAR